jgi:hypothetical protein
MHSILIRSIQMDFISKGEVLLSVCNPSHIPRQGEFVTLGMETRRVFGVHWEIKNGDQRITVSLIEEV